MTTRHPRSALACALAFLALSLSAAASADDQVLRELRRLVESNQHAAAYQLAEQHAALAGNPHFDFLYGLAAVNSRKLPQGVLALERHLSVVPANDRARLELARSYYELGEYARARQEFEFVLRYNPPKDVQANIQRYLDAMRTRESIGSRAASRSYLELAGGHDSNVNLGTYNDQVRLNTGILAPIDPSSGGKSSAYVRLAGGTQWSKRIDARLAVYAGADFDLKHNPSATRFDSGNLGGYLGFSVLKGKGLYRLSLADGQTWIDGNRYRNTLSLAGESQHSVGSGYTLTGLAQYADMSFSGTSSYLDAKVFTLGAGVQKTLQSPWRPTLGARVSWSREDNANNRDDLDREVFTTRLSLNASPSERVRVNFDLAYQTSDFGARDVFFGTTRADQTWMAEAGINYLATRNWLLRADVSYTDNDSNQDLYAHRRTLWSLRGRYLF